MVNYNSDPNDPHFGTTLGTYLLVYRFIGAGWAIQHTRDMTIEALRKIDRLLEADRTRHQKIAGRRRFEKPTVSVRDENGRKIR